MVKESRHPARFDFSEILMYGTLTHRNQAATDGIVTTLSHLTFGPMHYTSSAGSITAKDGEAVLVIRDGSDVNRDEIFFVLRVMVGDGKVIQTGWNALGDETWLTVGLGLRSNLTDTLTCDIKDPYQSSPQGVHR